MKRPIWQRVLIGEELWKDKTTKEKVLEVFGGFVVLGVFLSIGPLAVALFGIVFAFRYRKLLKADNE